MSSTLKQILTPEAKPQLTTASEAKRILLEQYLRGEAVQTVDAHYEIPRRDPETKAVLSFAQERMWFLDQLRPGSPVFNVPMAVRLTRPINLEALQLSLNEIVRRHETLRTHFTTNEGEPSAVVSAAAITNIQVIDLTNHDGATAESESRKLIEQEALRPFDLSRGPLIRTTLIRLDKAISIFVVVMHHIVSDGWSLLLFFKELAALYEHFTNQRADVPNLRINYADYAAWQRDWLRDDLVAQQLSYWKDKLAGDLPILDLPTDRSRPSMQTYAGAREIGVLPAALTQSLKLLSQQEGATLFMTVLAAFNILLHRLSGQEDIIVGSPIANRPRTETENLIGLFLNNLALRTDLSGNPTFRELLARTRQTALDAFANQDLPFEKLLEELKPERDLSRTSIFQVYFNLFSFSEHVQLPGGESTNFVEAWLAAEETLSKFDLTLYAGIDNDQLKLAFVYNPDLFSAERVAEMMRQLEHLLTQIVREPSERIGEFSLVTRNAGELLPQPTRSLKSHTPEAITSLISEQSSSHPQRVAIIESHKHWTYREIDLRSNQIANFLIERGISKGDVVAIYAHRSAALVPAILGALKAGAAFTILDPAYPAARLIDCLRIASPRAFIQIEAAGALSEPLRVYLEADERCVRSYLSSDASSDSFAQQTTEAPHVPIDSDDLAYIAFTSGSTGVPKGVMGRHGPLTLFTAWAVERFGLNESDRFCMSSGLAHDPLHRDIFTPLQLGGTLCIPDPIYLEDATRLREWMRAEGVTVANLTPAMAQLLCEQADATNVARLDRLRYSFLVGDILRQRDVTQLKQLAPSITCVNLYGATETQRAVGHYVADTVATKSSKQVLPLGTGIKDVQLLVLNQSMQLCGVGELGEIYFRSPYVAKGYLGDEALTRARFMINPFTKLVNDRIYRTGDLGRYLPDGNVEHAGRADRQIKIRAFRIEPAEIEAALIQGGFAREAVVMLSEKSASKTLIAYLVPADDSPTTPDKLREYLNGRLPAYMVPRAFVTLRSLPLTPNGKLDRRALPEPGFDAPVADNRDAAPQTPLQEQLISIWKTVLDLPAPLGIHDNFFELGGHSLIAVPLFAQIEKQFGKRLPLATLFRAPTVAQLAAAIESTSTDEQSSLVPIQPNGSRPPFFCVHAIGGNVLEYYDLAKHLGPDQPFYGLQSRGLNGEAPDTSIKEMASYYIVEMRRLQPRGPYFIGGRSLGGMIAYEMACQLRAANQEIALLAVLDSYPIGYDRLPGTSHSRVRRFAKRVRAHLSNIRGLPARERIGYVFAKSKFGPVQVKNKIWRTIYTTYQNLGLDLPKSLKDVEQFNWLAAQNYQPHPFDGRVTLFWASQDLRAKFDMLEGWRMLARGGLQLLEISGTHLDMIKEPYVADLAEKLNACLVSLQGVVF